MFELGPEMRLIFGIKWIQTELGLYNSELALFHWHSQSSVIQLDSPSWDIILKGWTAHVALHEITSLWSFIQVYASKRKLPDLNKSNKLLSFSCTTFRSGIHSNEFVIFLFNQLLGILVDCCICFFCLVFRQNTIGWYHGMTLNVFLILRIMWSGVILYTLNSSKSGRSRLTSAGKHSSEWSSFCTPIISEGVKLEH